MSGWRVGELTRATGLTVRTLRRGGPKPELIEYIKGERGCGGDELSRWPTLVGGRRW